jgi:hypothetical protein
MATEQGPVEASSASMAVWGMIDGRMVRE